MPAYDTQSYNTWLNAYQGPQAPNQGGQRTIGGSEYNPTGGYTYTPGMSWSDFVKQNVKQDLTPWHGGGLNQNFALGVASMGISQTPRAISSYRSFKKHQASQRHLEEQFNLAQKAAAARAPTEYLGAIDPTSRTFQQARLAQGNGSPLSQDELQMAYRQEQGDNQRSAMEKQIQAYFADPAREGWQRNIVNNRLQNDLANVQEDFGNNFRSSVQGSAAQGLQGGSVDAERRQGVTRARDTQAVRASSNADQALADFQGRDQQARGNLLGLVNSNGIGDSSQLSNALQGIHNATAQEGRQYAQGQQQRALDQFGQQQQSQVWGQGLNQIGAAINRNPNRGNSLSAWYGGNQTSGGGW
jgi:hypothetical protein